jgi:hypothetical protein
MPATGMPPVSVYPSIRPRSPRGGVLTVAIVQTPDGAVARLPLSGGRHATVDLADLPRVAAFRWYANYSDGRWRVLRYYRVDGQRTRSLPHELLDLPPAVRVAHVNGDGLDNRRANLRRSRATEGGAKRRLNRNNTSGYRGVSWHAPSGKWWAEINGKPRHLHLGYHDTAALERWGERARLKLADGERTASRGRVRRLARRHQT